MSYKLILFLFIFHFSFSQNNTVLVIYNAKRINGDSFKDKKDLSFIDEALNKYEVKFEFLFDNQRSLYRLKDELESEDYLKEIAQIFLGGTDVYYTNNPKSKDICQSETYGSHFIYPNQKHKWQLTRESKNISGYKCFKAVTTNIIINASGIYEQEVTAWYTPEINTSFGIKGYHDLPGLIIELQEGDLIYYVYSIDKNSKLEIVEPIKGKNISRKEFEELGSKYYHELGKY